MLVDTVGRMAREGFTITDREVRFGVARLARLTAHDWRRWATTRE